MTSEIGPNLIYPRHTWHRLDFVPVLSNSHFSPCIQISCGSTCFAQQRRSYSHNMPRRFSGVAPHFCHIRALNEGMIRTTSTKSVYKQLFKSSCNIARTFGTSHYCKNLGRADHQQHTSTNKPSKYLHVPQTCSDLELELIFEHPKFGLQRETAHFDCVQTHGSVLPFAPLIDICWSNCNIIPKYIFP